MTLGDIVRKYREDNQVSIDDFAKKCGLSKGYISMLENNINPRNNKPIAPTLITIRKIANAMNTDIDTILKALDKKQKISLNEVEMDGEQSNITPLPTTPRLSADEQELIDKYRSLNQLGKGKVIGYIDAISDDYKEEKGRQNA